MIRILPRGAFPLLVVVFLVAGVLAGLSIADGVTTADGATDSSQFQYIANIEVVSESHTIAQEGVSAFDVASAVERVMLKKQFTLKDLEEQKVPGTKLLLKDLARIEITFTRAGVTKVDGSHTPKGDDLKGLN